MKRTLAVLTALASLIACLLLAAPAATAAPTSTGAAPTGAAALADQDYDCHNWSYGTYGYVRLMHVTTDKTVYTKARPYGSASKIMILRRDREHWSNYWCKNRYGNIWYHVSSYDEEAGYGFVYSGYVRIVA